LEKETLILTAAGLLHDIGKVIYRTGIIDGRSHSVSGADFIGEITAEKELKDCIRYHHGRELARAKLSENALAYVTYIADNIASGTDRRDREIEGDPDIPLFDRSLPMEPVFNILNLPQGGKPRKSVYPAGVLNEKLPYPVPAPGVKRSGTDYNECYQNIRANLKQIVFDEHYLNSLLEITETYLSYVPCSTMTGQLPDISLFDHQKITAAVSACIFLFLESAGEQNYRKLLFDEYKLFYERKAFLMVSLDFSGIQKFIYNIRSKQALKAMRARSFYLEMFLEHICDEILLAGAGVARTNLIYTGGGHAYLLLPNTEEAKEQLDRFEKKINAWLVANYGTGLYLAVAAVACSGNDLMNKSDLMNQSASGAPYKAVYQELSRLLSLKKLQRYDAETILALNNFSGQASTRECKICGAVSRLEQDEDICGICGAFTKIAENIIQEDILIVTSPERQASFFGVELPSVSGGRWMYFMAEGQAKELLKSADSGSLRVYSKNKMYTGLDFSTKLWVGDYIKSSDLEDLAGQAEGIKRLAVLRADVDNLGSAFIKGFERSGEQTGEQTPEEKCEYQTLSRTAAFSRQMSLFFKYYINQILRGNFGLPQYSLTRPDKPAAPRRVAIVYSGGDDVFIVGAWNEVIETAADLQKAFEKYCLGSLTISAGLGVFENKYPISRMAFETADLEEKAKAAPEKNSLTLFTAETETVEGWQEDHTYSWTEFTGAVVGEKLQVIRNFFEHEEQERGRAFLYKLLEFLRKSGKEKINVARYAYLLARLEPRRESPHYKAYLDFSGKMYSWIFDDRDKKQVITAIYLYVYLSRKKEVDNT